MADHPLSAAEQADARRRRVAVLVELKLAATGVSVRTAAQYRSSATRYDGFTSAYGVASTPSPFLISAFTLASFRIGHKLQTIGGTLTGIAWRYGSDGEVTRMARHTLARLRSEHGSDPTLQAPAVPRGALLAMVRAARAGRRQGSAFWEMTTTRDVALITVGVAGHLRPAEMSLARIEGLVRHKDAYYLPIVDSKTNKDHRRVEGVWLTRRTDDLDPVGALDRHLAVLASMGITEGPLFPSSHNYDDDRSGLIPTFISEKVAIIAGWAGLPPGICGYSLRRSGATLSHVSGVPVAEIAAQLRHRSLDSTARYVDLILSEEDAAAWLAETIPAGWVPQARPPTTSPVWTDAGPLEDLIEEAAALAVEEVISVGPRCRSQYSNCIARWRMAAERDGIDPERPLPEDFALYLASEVERGLNPRALKSHIGALEWWYATLGNPQPKVIAVAVAVEDALLRSGRGAPTKRRAPSVSVSEVADVINSPPGDNEWRLHAAVLARALGVRLCLLDRTQAETARFSGQEASLVVQGEIVRLSSTGNALTCPVGALRALVERSGAGPLITPKEYVLLLNSITKSTGYPWEPSLMEEEGWQAQVDILARHTRARLRLVAGVCLGVGGLLGVDEALAVRWEHLHPHSVGLVARGSDLYPLPAQLEGRLFLARTDSLDLETALARLAAAWPWAGDGLLGCRGPVLTNMEPRHWTLDDPLPLSTGAWNVQVRTAGKRIGLIISPWSLRVAGAHEEWFAHHDELRLQARMGHVFPSATRNFLKKHGLLGASATEPEVA